MDLREKYQFWVANSTSKTITLFFCLEFYEAIKKYDIAEAENVCSRANGNLHFSDDLLKFVVENNMNDVFTMLERYGARFNLYSDVGINLILIAIANGNLALCESIFSLAITENTVECPNALQLLDPVIAQIFQNGRIDEYGVLKKYIAEIDVKCGCKEFLHYPEKTHV